MIELHGLYKSFGTRRVLRSVNLSVPKGCLYGLIGPGAAGKSVILKTIAGLLHPDAGSIKIDGVNLNGLSPAELHDVRKRFGMLFQNNALFDYMTVAENVAFPLRRLFQLPESEIQARVRDRLALVGLSDFLDRLPAGLSGGQKKRVGFARATVSGAPILLYDEPAAGLDPVTSQRLFDLLRREQRASGATVLMVSSDLDRLLPATDRVGMMVGGELIFEGTTKEARICSDPRVDQFVHGKPEGPL